jgi:hypothetical protein
MFLTILVPRDTDTLPPNPTTGSNSVRIATTESSKDQPLSLMEEMKLKQEEKKTKKLESNTIESTADPISAMINSAKKSHRVSMQYPNRASQIPPDFVAPNIDMLNRASQIPPNFTAPSIPLEVDFNNIGAEEESYSLDDFLGSDSLVASTSESIEELSIRAGEDVTFLESQEDPSICTAHAEEELSQVEKTVNAMKVKAAEKEEQFGAQFLRNKWKDLEKKDIGSSLISPERKPAINSRGIAASMSSIRSLNEIAKSLNSSARSLNVLASHEKLPLSISYAPESDVQSSPPAAQERPRSKIFSTNEESRPQSQIGQAMPLSEMTCSLQSQSTITSSKQSLDDIPIARPQSTITSSKQSLDDIPIARPQSAISSMKRSVEGSSESIEYIDALPAIALADYVGTEEGQLTLVEGETLYVLDQDIGNGWAYGEFEGKQGVFPQTFVRYLEIEEEVGE